MGEVMTIADPHIAEEIFNSPDSLSRYTTHDCLLKIDRVSLRYGPKLVLRDVSAEIHDIERTDATQGQVVCFLGPSGIGKSQLSRIIAGLPASGDAHVTGRVLLHGKPVRQGHVGMVPQQYRLFEFATVEENLKIAGGKNWREKGDLYLKGFDLERYLAHYPRSLSGGTRQRVAIVRQLLSSEHFIIMDEPFSGLDVRMKARAMEIIRTVSQLHTLNTIIVVTHDVTEGMSIADRVWLMGLTHEDGAWREGATIVDTYDLAAEGLAWRTDLLTDPVFLARVADVKAQFDTLAP